MNQYHEEFEELQNQGSFRGQTWFGKRQALVEEYSWAVPNEDVLSYLAAFGEITEVGAGSGYWAKCVNERGGDVRPYDIDPSDDAWTGVLKEDVSDMHDDCFDNPVLLVWPALNEGVATTVAEKEPPFILYVGEPRSGCTAEDEFFDVIESKYGLIGAIDIPSYHGVHDKFYHYARNV